MINLSAVLAERASSFKAHVQAMIQVTVLTIVPAFVAKYSVDPVTNRHKRDENGTIEYTHYRIRCSLADGTFVNLLVRQDYIFNRPTTDPLGKLATVLLGEGAIATQNYPKAGIKKGDPFVNTERFVFDERYILNETAANKGLIQVQ